VGRGHDLAAVLLGGADVDQGRAVAAPDGIEDLGAPGPDLLDRSPDPVAVARGGPGDLGGEGAALQLPGLAAAWWAQALAGARADPAGGADRARLCRKLAWIMAATPGAFRSIPDPAVVDQFVTEGLAAATDELSRAWLLLARGVSARLWRGSEPFGQGMEPDPVPIGERIADVERALAAGEADSDEDLVTAASSCARRP
jgi:hypothetical protein